MTRLALPRRSLADRLWERVDMSVGLFGCWPVSGGHTTAGYGVISRGGREGAQATTNCVALELKLGRRLLPGMFACHTCDNPPCCNPAHLFEGTHQANVDDMVAKGRGATGDRNGARLHPELLHPATKLTPQQADEIRARALAGEDRAALAREFGVSRSWPYRLVPGRQLGRTTA
jgi:hypothetical protein